jgi:hypothetical protein
MLLLIVRPRHPSDDPRAFLIVCIKAGPVLLRLRPDGAANDRVGNIEIRARGGGVSIGIYRKQSGAGPT